MSNVLNFRNSDLQKKRWNIGVMPHSVGQCNKIKEQDNLMYQIYLPSQSLAFGTLNKKLWASNLRQTATLEKCD